MLEDLKCSTLGVKLLCARRQFWRSILLLMAGKIWITGNALFSHVVCLTFSMYFLSGMLKKSDLTICHKHSDSCKSLKRIPVCNRLPNSTWWLHPQCLFQWQILWFPSGIESKIPKVFFVQVWYLRCTPLRWPPLASKSVTNGCTPTRTLNSRSASDFSSFPAVMKLLLTSTWNERIASANKFKPVI